MSQQTQTPQPRHFDHVANLTDPARAEAAARARETSIKMGDAYAVYFTDADGRRRYWVGDRYDALTLAKDLTWPARPADAAEHADVRLVGPQMNPRVYDGPAVRALHF